VRFCYFSVLIFLVLGPALFTSVADVESLFEQEEFDALKSALPEVVAAFPNDPAVIFFQGFTHANPDQAVSFYKRVVDEFPSSKYADYAMFRLGQYYYFEGDFTLARRYYSRVFRSYPESDLRDDAQYLYCQCIMAEGKTDSAKLFLKTFVQNAKRSPYVDAAILDVESLGGLSQEALTASDQKKKQKIFAIQVATYKNLSDARDAVHKLSRVFPNVKVGERTLGNTTYNRVLIGKFTTKDKAADYARLYIKPHLSEYKIIELEK
jgi:tetratricopeptide (TPR) repeat protein